MSKFDWKGKIVPALSLLIFLGMAFVIISIILGWPEKKPVTEIVEETPIDNMEQGQFHIENRNFDLAIDAFNEAILEDSDNEKAWHEKGKLLNRLNECQDAHLHYERYLDKFPESSRAIEGAEIANNC